MRVDQRRVLVPVRMRLARWIAGGMSMLVMCIVYVPMFVFQCFVLMLMLVTLGEMKP